MGAEHAWSTRSAMVLMFNFGPMGRIGMGMGMGTGINCGISTSSSGSCLVEYSMIAKGLGRREWRTGDTAGVQKKEKKIEMHRPGYKETKRPGR